MKGSRRDSGLFRLSSALLLLLALSPFTAPFSTCDLLDVFGGIATAGGAILQSKTEPKAPATALNAISPLHVTHDRATRSVVFVGAPAAHSIDTLPIPLRI
jgi:hypothetical protein